MMVKELVKDPAAILKEMNTLKMAAIHAVLGIAGEVGELEELEDDNHLLEEGGDLLFYCRDLRHALSLGPYVKSEGLHSLVFYAGMIVDLVKKAVIYGQEFDDERLLSIEMYLDQVETQVELLLNDSGFTRGDALEHNLQKLMKSQTARYRDGYSDEAAAARRDKGGEG